MSDPPQHPADDAHLNAALDGFVRQMRRLHAMPGIGSRALGVPDWDHGLQILGRRWLADHPAGSDAADPAEAPVAARRPDLYLATQVARDGGHTALIGDFVRALDPPGQPPAGAGRNSHLVLTNIHGENTPSIPEDIRTRTCIPAEHITVLPGPEMIDRLRHLFSHLQRLRPARLFLFQHPDDPLASAAAQPEFAPQRVLVHFSDAQPTFGLHLPGTRLIDLNPVASAMSRLIGLDPALLLLTAPDPGPRPHGFLRRGKLTTMTAGRAGKYSGGHAYAYPDAVGVILRCTGGWHVHIGPLDDSVLSEIAAALRRERIPAERFVHVPWTPSLARALWEHGCDLYLSSFPIDGARTNAEVLASATPHLRFSARHAASAAGDDLGNTGGLVWRNWEDLAGHLRDMAHAPALEEASAAMRRVYEARHHPGVFADTLQSILAGHGGMVDPREHERDHRSIQMLLNSLLANLIDFSQSTTAALDHQRQRIDFLQDQRRRLQEKLADAASVRKRARTGNSLRARLLRWLTKGEGCS